MSIIFCKTLAKSDHFQKHTEKSRVLFLIEI